MPRIILVTAYGREEIMRQAEKMGLDGFLIKPVSPSVMFDTIMQAFGQEAPRELRTDTEKELEAAAAETLSGANVLLVEDNEINQQVAMEILSGAGHQGDGGRQRPGGARPGPGARPTMRS